MDERRHERLGVLDRPAVLLLAVDQDLLDVGGEEVADHPEDEVALLVERRARRRLGEPRLDLLPDPHEELDVGAELRLPPPSPTVRTMNPPPRRPQAPDELAQAVALPASWIRRETPRWFTWGM